MGSLPKARRKRIVLVNRDFQLRYTKAAIGVGILSTMLTSVIILCPLYIFEILRIPRFLPLPILSAMAVAVLINIFFIGMMGVFITHKIAGPMYSLVRHLRRVGMKRYGAFMRLRDDDDLKFVVRNFNEMQEGLQRITLEDLEVLKAVLAGLESRPEQKEALHEEYEALASLTAEMEKRLAE